MENPFNIFMFLSMSFLLMNISSCLDPTLSNASISLDDAGFSPALATWYGDSKGPGSGGACGWDNDVGQPPFSAMISAGNGNIFLHGKGCGNCYQVKCLRKPYCSTNPITVTITDECPGACNNVPFHFDLSGYAFGAMASQGQADNLRQLGQVDVQYRRVPCNNGGYTIAMKTSPKCNPYWFAAAIEYTNGDGGISSVEIKAANSNQWVSTQNIWGAVWKADISPSFAAPYSFKITSAGKTVVAWNVVPNNFAPGNTYQTNVNF